MFGVQSFGSGNIIKIYFRRYKEADALYKIAQFDLSTDIDDSQECLRGYFNYALSLFNEPTIREYIATYTEILQQFAKIPTAT